MRGERAHKKPGTGVHSICAIDCVYPGFQVGMIIEAIFLAPSKFPPGGAENGRMVVEEVFGS